MNFIYLRAKKLRGLASPNVLKLILKSPRFVPFGANLTLFGCQICHPCVIDRSAEIDFCTAGNQPVCFGHKLGLF